MNRMRGITTTDDRPYDQPTSRLERTGQLEADRQQRIKAESEQGNLLATAVVFGVLVANGTDEAVAGHEAIAAGAAFARAWKRAKSGG